MITPVPMHPEASKIVASKLTRTVSGGDGTLGVAEGGTRLCSEMVKDAA
jgi:hypothetical protein